MKDKSVNITINDIKAEVPADWTILQAAESLEITIPTLCHHKELSPSGACRTCIVEINKRGRTFIDASCVCPVEEGMVVETDSPRVRRERALIISLLLSRAPDSKQILALAEEYGVETGLYESADRGESRCIVCGLCIRVCNELIGAQAIGTAFRGLEKKVLSPYKIARSLCIGCLACEKICPTGAIAFQVRKGKLEKEEWGVSLPLARCSDCGNPVGPQRQIEFLHDNVPVETGWMTLCPECKRKRSRGGIYV